jgi:hypothetical protein
LGGRSFLLQFRGICEHFIDLMCKIYAWKRIVCSTQIANFALYQHIKEMSRFEQLKSLVMGLEGDFDKFYNKGNKAAGTRIRKGMQDLKVLAQDIRKEVQDSKNAD